MKTMTLTNLQDIIKDLHSDNMSEVIAASNRFNDYGTLIPFSVFQPAYNLYKIIQTSCCIQKAQASFDYDNLCKAIIQIQNKVIN